MVKVEVTWEIVYIHSVDVQFIQKYTPGMLGNVVVSGKCVWEM